MIPRYTREEIGAVWTQRRRMEGWLEVELAVTEALAEAGVVPAGDAAACRERAGFTVEAVEDRERTTNHDVAAFVDVVSASIGPEGRWIHYGLTSSDVLDTALATQIRAAGEIVVAGAVAYRDALVERAFEHRDTVCVGRTHGIHAEPTSFGLRLAGFAFEADRNVRRLERAFAGARFGKLSGAVGTYASLPPSVEAAVMERLGLGVEDASTQIVPRDRHADLLSASRSPAPASSASRPRSETCSGPRSARSRSRSARARRAPRRCRTSATRSRPSGSPASPASCAATRRRASRTSPSGTSATSPTPGPSG